MPANVAWKQRTDGGIRPSLRVMTGLAIPAVEVGIGGMRMTRERTTKMLTLDSYARGFLYYWDRRLTGLVEYNGG